MGAIYVFHMYMQIDNSTKYSYDRQCLPALGFSGITNLEDDLHRIVMVAHRHDVGRFFTHYPQNDLVVATARPHFDPSTNYQHQDQHEFQKIFFRNESRYITRKDLIINCPSLSKFNGCLTCAYSLGSLPCFIKVFPQLYSGNDRDLNFMRIDDLPRSTRSLPNVRTHQVYDNLIWVPTSHATSRWRGSRSGILLIGDISSPAQIAENVKSASESARQGHRTKVKIAEQCPQCYFGNMCQRRWRVRHCPEAYSREKVIASLIEKVTYTCRQEGLSLEELKYFINAGGHEVYPFGAQLTFRGLDKNFTHGVFYTKYGRNMIHCDLPHTRRLLQARFYHNHDYSHAVKPGRHCEVPDEMLGVYYELCRVNTCKRNYGGWNPYSKIKSLSIGRDETMQIDFFGQSSRYVRSYASLLGNMPYQLTELM